MRVYSSDGTQIGEALSYANVSGVGMDILLAKYYDAPSTEEQKTLKEQYLSIYDENVGGTQEFYCLVDVSDYAREYSPPDDVASEDNTRGNISESFWLYDDIYSRIFDKSGFGLTMNDLTSVMSNRYGNEDTAEEVIAYLEENKQDSTSWSENAVTFALDPTNNPSYEVIGYTALASSKTITAQASNGTNLTVRVSAGRDRKPLQPETIRIFLDPCTMYGSELSGEGDNITLLASVEELGSDAAAITARNEKLSKTGDDYVISVNVGTLTNGNYYLVKVEGEDQAGYEIADINGKFGLQIIASGNPPVLTVTAPEDLSYTNEGSIHFYGTVEAEDGLASLTAKATITKASGGASVRSNEAQTFTVVPSNSNPNWEFTLDTTTAMGDPDLYLVEVFMEASDTQNKTTPQRIRLYVDNAPPQAEITNVSPYYEYNEGTYTVNGTISIVLSMTDNDQLASYEYTIGTTSVEEPSVSIPSVNLLIPDIDTTLENDKENLSVAVTLHDRAGNSAIISLPDTLYVNQDTDKPVIELTNPDQLAESETEAQDTWIVGSSITGSITDDDGVASLTLKINGADKEVTLSGTGKQKRFSCDLLAEGIPDGIHELELTAIDTAGVKSDLLEGWFSYDTENPELQVETGPPDLTNTGFDLTGTVSDSNALDPAIPIVITQSKDGAAAQEISGNISLVDNTPGSGESFDWTLADLPRNPASPLDRVAFDGSQDGSYEYEITVYDRAGQFSTKTITVQLDSKAPTATIEVPPESSEAGNVVGTNTTFSGTAADADPSSGINKIRYSFDETNWTDMAPSTSWNVTHVFDAADPEGEKTLYVEAEDTAGNVSGMVSRAFVFDRATPTLAITRDSPGVNELFRDGEFSLSGTAYDTHGIASIVITQGTDGEVSSGITIDASSAPNYTWSVTGLPRDPGDLSATQVADGEYNYKIYAVDLAGKPSSIATVKVTIDTTPPNINTITHPNGSTGVSALSGTTYQFRGMAEDAGVGVAKVWYQITKNATAPAAGDDPSTAGYTELATSRTWSFIRDLVDYTPTPAAGQISEGVGYYLHVLAEDASGNRTTEAVSERFDVDLSNPTVTESELGVQTEVNRREGFVMLGEATDSHGVVSVTITQSLDSGNPIDISTNGPVLTGSGTGFEWELQDLPRGNTAGTIGTQALVDGTYEYQITTTDLVGKTHTIVRRVRFDATGPDIEFTAPAEGGWQNSGDVTVTGLATDLTGVEGVYYSMDEVAPDLPVEPATDADRMAEGWLVAGGTPGSWEIVLTGLGEGSHNVWVSAMDSNANTSPAIQRTFGVDTGAPQLSDVSTPSANMNSGFDLTGTVSDSNALDPAIPIVITQSKDGAAAQEISGNISLVDNTPGSGESFDWTLADLPRNPASPLDQIAFDGSADGLYSFVITATDIAGKTYNISRTVLIDTQAPVLNIPTGVEETLTGWKKDPTLSISGDVTETGSGMDRIEYSLNGGESQVLSLTYPNWSGNIPLSNGMNQTISLTAYDKAGNAVTSATYTFNVDQDSPSIEVQTPTGLQRTNLATSVESTYTVTDSGLSGVASVLVTSIGGNVIAETDQTSTNTGGDSWEISIPDTTLSSLGLASGSSYVVTTTATDVAGNTSVANFSILVDTQPPEVGITSPEADTEINKETEIKGTASDDQLLEQVDLYIEDPTTGLLPAAPTQSFTGGSAYNWSYDFDTEAWESAGGSGEVSVRVLATDEAGNTETLDYTYTVDQESDRPRIRSSNILFDDSDADYPTTLQMTKNVIGTIEDDDGPVSSVEIWKETSEGVWEWVPQPMSGISYIYQSYGDDGLKILRFRITDAEGEVFETGGTLPPKFEWGAGGAGEYSYDERSYRVDTSIPSIMPNVYVHRTAGDTFEDAEILTPNMAFGGTSAQFRLWMGANDDNGIATIQVEIPGAVPETQTLDDSDIDQPASITDFVVFRSANFDISSVTDGVATINITVTDNSGLESYASKTILIDNTPPEIDNTYPVHESDQVFGNLTISGLASDDGSGLDTIEYKIGYDYASQPTWLVASTSGASWSITDFALSGGGEPIEDYARKLVETVSVATDTLTVTDHGYVDGTQVWIGADSLPGGLSHSTGYYVRNSTADTFQLSETLAGAIVNITSEGDASVGVSARASSSAGNIWYLPIMIRAIDKAGNEYLTEEWNYRIKIDPSGDKPSAHVSYPEADANSAQPNPIVGGTIRMSGYAEDNIDVSAVYMQIDVNGDGEFTAADVDSEGVDWFNGGVGHPVSGSRNWTQTINKNGEFNPETSGTRRLIQYRVRAQDNNGLYGSWTDSYYFEVDEDVPQFGLLTFEQDGRTRVYEQDMWLSGDWTLTGTIMDESNIGEIEVGNTAGESSSYVTGDLSTPGWFSAVSSGSLYGYEMSIPVNTETDFPATQTSHSFTISATDLSDPPMTADMEIRINYDNKEPDVTAAYEGVTPIRNSNGSYELTSTVVEEGSGLDRVMVVFHRPDGMTDGGRVYNPLYGTGAAENYTLWSNLTESDEGLPLMEYTGAIRPNTTALTLTGISSDPYAQEGYYLRIGGLYYRITDVTGDTISWEGDVDESIVDFELVYAIAVDLLSTEVTDQDGDGIIEAVTRSGGTYDWSCSIDSTNLPDGQLNIRYVAFDAAGNHSDAVEVETRVENNPPLLAQVALATDLDGSGSITDGSGATVDEWNPPYSTLAAGVEQKTATVTATDFTAKDFMEVVIDIVGGNGDLQYQLDVDATTVHALTAGNLRAGEYVEGLESTDTITVTLAQLQAMGDGERDFVFSIWDSTETYALGASTDFKAELTVTLNVDVIDEIAPMAVVSPFYWNSATDNSLYNNSRENGHIELEDDLPGSIFDEATGLFDSDPKVSGKISIRGTAYDDQRITALWMYIGDTAVDGNFDFPPTATTKTFGGKTYYRMAVYSPGSGWTATASDMTTNGWVFSAEDEYLDQNGHLVSWQLDWNTAELDTVAAVDRYVRIVAEDKRATPNTSSEAIVSNPGDVTTNNVPYYRMDVVPYITAISTADNRTLGGLKDVNIRSSDGKYSILQGSTASFMTVTGFNFDPNAVRIVDSATVATNTVGTGSGIGITHAAGATTSTMTVSNNIASSGYLEIFSNGVRTLNNVNDNDAAGSYTGSDPLQYPNREPDLYVRKNPTLNDDRYIRLFDMKDTGVKNGYYPEMLLDGDDPVFAYLNLSGGPGSAPGIASGTGAGTYQSANAMPQRATFNGTTAAEITTEYLIKGLAWDQMAMAQDESGRFHHVSVGNYAGDHMTYIYDRYAELHSSSNGSGTGWVQGTEYVNYYGSRADDANNNAISMDSNSEDPGLLVGRYQGLKMKVTGDSRTDGSYATVYMAYYDDNTTTKDILFRNFRIGTNHASVTSDLYNGGTSSTGDSYEQATNIGDPENDTRLTATSSASKHFDFGITSDNRVVLVFYDETNSRLYLRYSNAAVDGSDPDGTIAWTTSSTVFPSYVGNYVSLDIDSNDGIHISAYDAADGDLAYLYLPSYNSTALEYVTVDAAFSVGYWTKIKVLEDAGTITPYIAYYNSTENGQRDTIKLAYAKSGITAGSIPGGVDSSGYTTGDWEYLNVPALTPPQGGDNRFKQVSLDFDTSNRPVVGYLGTNLEFGTWVDE